MAPKRTHWIVSTGLILALAASLPPGCSDESSTSPPIDAGGDGDLGPQTDTVQVALLGRQHDYVLPLLRPEPVAIEGALVALSLRGGDLVLEELTAGEGVASFEVAEGDWPDGDVADVTAAAEGYAVASRVGVERPADDEPIELVLWPSANEGPGRARIGGIAQHRAPDRRLYVGATAPGSTFYQQTGQQQTLSDWSLDVPVGQPFDIVATDFSVSYDDQGNLTQSFAHWARASYEGVTEDAVVTIDFEDDAVESLTVSGTVVRPARTNSPLNRDTAYLIVDDGGSDWSGAIGFVTATQNGPLEVGYDVEYVEPTSGSILYQ